MKHSKFKKKNKIRKSYVYIIVLFFIILITYKIYSSYGRSVNPKINKVIEVNIDEMINNIIVNYSLEENYDSIDNIIIINKNKKEEIIDIDFDLEKLYMLLKKVTYKLKNDLNNLENKNDNDFINNYLKKKKNKYILMVPIGIASNNIYLSNLGPKIPVEVKFIGNIITGVKTNVVDYGINNSLIELYVTVNINTLLLTPVNMNKKEYSYKILVDSKIIEGKVPEIYGKSLENSSPLNIEKMN